MSALSGTRLMLATVTAVGLFPTDDVEKDRVGLAPGVLREKHRKLERHRETVGLLHKHAPLSNYRLSQAFS